MVTVAGVACYKEARVKVMPKAMRVVRDEEGEGSKAMATATRVAGDLFNYNYYDFWNCNSYHYGQS
jgi:hypothetical protein